MAAVRRRTDGKRTATRAQVAADKSCAGASREGRMHGWCPFGPEMVLVNGYSLSGAFARIHRFRVIAGSGAIKMLSDSGTACREKTGRLPFLAASSDSTLAKFCSIERRFGSFAPALNATNFHEFHYLNRNFPWRKACCSASAGMRTATLDRRLSSGQAKADCPLQVEEQTRRDGYTAANHDYRRSEIGSDSTDGWR